MTHIVLDAPISANLVKLNSVVEVRDPGGNIIGQFIPVNCLFDPRKEGPPLTEEEIQRRLNSAKWYTTAEVLAYLEKL